MINTQTLIPSTSYPLFFPNQVLSNQDLNDLVIYLESQNRLSRNRFIGMGIVCGLVPSATFQSDQNPKATITISPGSGVTSEGYGVTEPQTVNLTHYQYPQEVPATRFQVSQETLSSDNLSTAISTPTESRASEQAEAGDAPILYTLTELFTEAGSNRRSLDLIGKQQNEVSFKDVLAEHILIILYELEDTRRDNCLLDCDDLGQDRSFKPRYFLVPKTATEEDVAANRLSADTLLEKGYSPNELPDPWTELSVPEIFQYRQSFFHRHRMQVPRFGVGDAPPSGQSPADEMTELSVNGFFRLKNYAAFLDRYRALCDQTIEQIKQVLPHVVEIFSPFFSSFHPQPTTLDEVGDRLTTHLQNILATTPFEAQYTVQYFSDYLVQVVAAYEELVHAAFDLMDDCLPDIRRFPKFLMLGQIPVLSSSDSTDDSSLPLSNLSDPYRSHFVQPPLYNQNHQRRRQVRHLYDRLVRLCAKDSFVPLPFYAAPVHITPSRDRTHPLSEQAIPYYLNYAKLYDLWNYDVKRKGLSAYHPAYFLPEPNSNGTGSNTASDATDRRFISRDDLRYRLDVYNVYRIEGHLGKDKATVLEQLRDYRQQWNLAFDIITLKIGDRPDPDDGDALINLDQSGRLESIQQDFEGMTQIFQSLWILYAENDQNPEKGWSQNTFLATLKYVFFDQPRPSDILRSQLYNPVLAAIRADSTGQVYEFNAIANEPGRYRLIIRGAEEAPPLAQVFFQQDGESRVDHLDLSGIQGDDAFRGRKSPHS